jgi:GDPmannose 4,6-dehydratase
VADPTKARTVLGWEPRTSFAQLVGMMVENDLRELSRREGAASGPLHG